MPHHFDESLHPRGADGRWTKASASQPAAALDTVPEIHSHHVAAPADTRVLEALREKVSRALDAVINAHVAHAEALVRDRISGLPGWPKVSLSCWGDRLVTDEVWDPASGEVLDDEQWTVPANPTAVEEIRWRIGLRGQPYVVDADGPDSRQACQALARAQVEHRRASERLVDGVLSAANALGARSV